MPVGFKLCDVPEALQRGLQRELNAKFPDLDKETKLRMSTEVLRCLSSNGLTIPQQRGILRFVDSVLEAANKRWNRDGGSHFEGEA